MVVDKLLDSILRMEYSWEFMKLRDDRGKIKWALSHADFKIVQWNDRRGFVDETYEEWKSTLISRFFRKLIEIKNFINCKREVNQRLSAFIIEIETAGKRLGIS